MASISCLIEQFEGTSVIFIAVEQATHLWQHHRHLAKLVEQLNTGKYRNEFLHFENNQVGHVATFSAMPCMFLITNVDAAGEFVCGPQSAGGGLA